MKKQTVRKILMMLTAATLVVGSMAGCGKKGGEKAQEENAEKIANVILTSEPDNIDASRGDSAVKGMVILEVQESLFRNNVDGESEPAGAESWEVSEDGKVYTFKIRDNKYSDGTDVLAADYANGLIRTLDPEVASTYAANYYFIEGAEAYNTAQGSKEEVGIKALDDKTLEIRLNEPIPYFIQMLTAVHFTPIPESRTEGEANVSYGSNAEDMSFSGPFAIKKWTRGEGFEVVKNEEYWDAENVKLEGVNFLLVAETNTQQQMFEQGKVDVLKDVTAEYFEKSAEKIENGDIHLFEHDKPALLYLSFNNQDPEGIFTNAKIRKAFSLAIDRDLYFEKVVKKDQVAYGVIPPATNNGDIKFRANHEDPLLAMKEEDPKALFEEGLAEIGKAGEQITITYLQGDANNNTKVRSEFFQNQWESKLGVKVKIDTAADNATFNNMVNQGLYQVCNTGWAADYNDPMTFMKIFTSEDSNNNPRYSNPVYDQLINDCISELDMSVREQKFAEAEQLIMEEAAIAPLNYGLAKNFIQDRLKNVSFNGAGGPDIELKTAYIE